MADDNQNTEVNTSDDKTSKLEVALKLAKFTIGGSWVLWALAVGVSVIAPLINPEAIVQPAQDIAAVLLPINTGTTGILLGYIVGKQDK